MHRRVRTGEGPTTAHPRANAARDRRTLTVDIEHSPLEASLRRSIARYVRHSNRGQILRPEVKWSVHRAGVSEAGAMPVCESCVSLYHGTSAANAEAIVADGAPPSVEGSLRRGTPCPTWASWCARSVKVMTAVRSRSSTW